MHSWPCVIKSNIVNLLVRPCIWHSYFSRTLADCDCGDNNLLLSQDLNSLKLVKKHGWMDGWMDGGPLAGSSHKPCFMSHSFQYLMLEPIQSLEFRICHE